MQQMAIEFLTGLEKQFDYLPKSLRFFNSDNGTEIVTTRFEEFLKGKGIKHMVSPPGTPEYNSLIERAHRTMNDAVQAMLAYRDLPKVFTVLAWECVVYVRNRCTSSAIEGGKTPYELLNGFRPTVHHLRIFGSKCYAKVKGRPRAILCLFVGYDPEGRCYKVLDVNSREVFRSRDVVFDETKASFDGPVKDLFDDLNGESVNEPAVNDDIEVDTVRGDDSGPTRALRRSARLNNLVEQESILDEDEVENDAILDFCGMSESLYEDDPLTFEAAVNGPDSAEWWKAVADELNSFESQEVWSPSNLPTGFKPLLCTWVFKKKRDQHGNVTDFRARLCIRGDLQVKGIDYFDTYAPVASRNSVGFFYLLQ